LGIRDRAMLEILYSTGMRRMELADRTVYSVQPERRTVMIRRGKGAKDRIVPIGDRALYWYGRYLEEVRPKLVVEPDPETLFLSARGAAMSLIDLSQIIGGYVRAAGVSKIGACHLFRHCVATAMLNNGADIRFIQEMLGHTRLETTQRYTHVSIEKLKQVHAQTHPTSRPARDQTEAGETELTREELLEELLSDDEKGEGEE
jgi:integrase/recombinase XerD